MLRANQDGVPGDLLKDLSISIPGTQQARGGGQVRNHKCWLWNDHTNHSHVYDWWFKKKKIT